MLQQFLITVNPGHDVSFLMAYFVTGYVIHITDRTGLGESGHEYRHVASRKVAGKGAYRDCRDLGFIPLENAGK